MSKTWDNIHGLLHSDIKNAIKALNFPTMTPIQAATIPQLINNKDVVAEAVTGSGKTLAFIVPLLEILKRRAKDTKWKKNEIGALIISPTRELALQIREVLDHFLEFVSGLSRLLLVGGSSIEDDLNKIKSEGGNVVICTPGRLEDLLSRKNDINFAGLLKSLEILILDEADRLLDYGFRGSIDTILSYLPKQRRTGLFSATQTKQVEDLIRAGLRNPVLISVSVKAEYSTPEQLNNYYINVKNNNKLATLLSFIRTNKIQKGLLFLPTCATVDYWADVFRHLETIPILAIHGKMKEKRKRILEKFKKIPRALLLCTDVLARGIDIPEVDWVLQWDPPSNAQAFVHRVGRTARQGHQGSSLVLLLENETAYVPFIEANQRVQLNEFDDNSDENQSDILRRQIQDLQMKNRDLMEKATRAFVSHIRAYSKYECSLLLKVKELPLCDVASTYGLLKLPKMPELKNFDLSSFKGVEIDLNSIPYKDKKKEAIRQQKLKIFKETGTWPGHKIKIVKKSTEPWSLAKQKKIEKKEKKLKRKQAKENKSNSQDNNKRKRKGISDEDMMELTRDIALMKKLKKKKISEEQFDKEFGLSNL